ncbi:MAG TPA: RNA 2',3'-cyclic phosphodiesterase [Bacteroidota bacterium]|nr:RNA 2',3'-cyclic phosphodiesterase [Bacteroidota bacterium]
MGSIRSFIAFETPALIRKKMLELQTELKKSNAHVRWEPESKFHATLSFLGNIQEQLLPKIIEKIQETLMPFSIFDIIYQNLGAFPNNRTPHVIWIGCHNPDGKLQQMKETLDGQLEQFGVQAENRQFRPHITLGRVKSPKGRKDLIQKLESLTFQPMAATITDIAIMKSILKPEGSEYSILKTISLQE